MFSTAGLILPRPFRQTDQLLAPAHYPNPITKYTVDEMSLVWQIYGGYDFKGMLLLCCCYAGVSLFSNGRGVRTVVTCLVIMFVTVSLPWLSPVIIE